MLGGLRAWAGDEEAPKKSQAAELLIIEGTLSGKISEASSFFILPITPPIANIRQSLQGTSNIGPLTWTDTHTVHLDPTVPFFKPTRFTDGIALVDFGEGNALFLNWSGLEKTDLPPNLRGSVDSFQIFGGRGQFIGATGSGGFTTELDLPGDGLTVEFNATVLLPANVKLKKK
jgi:hypothetical protein